VGVGLSLISQLCRKCDRPEPTTMLVVYVWLSTMIDSLCHD